MIGFAVIGRPFNPDVNADGYVRNEPAILLKELAERNPKRTWAVLGRPTASRWTHMPENVSTFLPSTEMADGIVVWLAGGFAAMRQDTPRLDGESQEYRRTLAVYVQPITDILQAHRGKTVWIVNDPRSYFRARDVTKPREILSQHYFWKEGVEYIAAGADMAAMPWYPKCYVKPRNGSLKQVEVVASVTGKHGRQEAITRWGAHNLYPLTQSAYRAWLYEATDTVLFPPSSRSRWITAKFWECAANGVIPWLAEGYDEQNISGINNTTLEFLRVPSPHALAERRTYLFSNPIRLKSIRDRLRYLYEVRYCEHQLVTTIEDRFEFL